MKHEQILTLTRTAVLLALTIVFQMLRPLLVPILGSNNLFVIGSLVNMSLLVAAIIVGIPGGVFISVVAPIVAFFQGHLAFAFMIPVVALGNAAIVVLFNLFYSKNKWIALAVASVGKSALLYAGVKIVLNFVNIAEKQAAVLSANFSWPQLVTAVIGGIIAIPVLRLLDKALKKDTRVKA